MIALLAFRNVGHRPWRSVLMFLGYGVGVGVMIILLSVGEALLTQAKQEKLVGGGDITVLPQGLNVELMKTGGIGGLYFSIPQARFVHLQLLGSPRLAQSIEVAAPQIENRLVYLRTADGEEHAVRAGGEIPSLTNAVRGSLAISAGSWEDDDLDRRWMAPTAEELRHDIDHFHLPPPDLADRSSWAEWHYFNVVSPDSKRWAFISFILGGDVTSTEWGGSVSITMHEQGRAARRFESRFEPRDIGFSTTSANLRIGSSLVTVLPDGDYRVVARAASVAGGAPVSIDLVVSPEPRAYFPGASLDGEGYVSGYTVPALRADAAGRICVGSSCETYTGAQAYHDHNWGTWSGVTWDWGAGRAGEFGLLYGRVTGDGEREKPLFVYLVDRDGFRAMMRPERITYTDGRTAVAGGQGIAVPSRAVFADVRGADTLRVELDVEDAVATDIRRSPLGREGHAPKPWFIQMKGTLRLSGRLGGEPVAGEGTGFFETYR